MKPKTDKKPIKAPVKKASSKTPPKKSVTPVKKLI